MYMQSVIPIPSDELGVTAEVECRVIDDEEIRVGSVLYEMSP